MLIIELEKRGSIMLMTLNRPDMMNALGQEGDGPAIAAACAFSSAATAPFSPLRSF